MEFHFSVMERNTGRIIVDANDYDEAVEKVNEAYYLGAIDWADVEMSLNLDRSYD